MAQRAAIVTGASSGIGLEIARVLGQEGYATTLAARVALAPKLNLVSRAKSSIV